MRKSLLNQLLGEFKIDQEYDIYLASWIAYCKASDAIDGHIRKPKSKEDFKTLHAAMRAGMQAQEEVLKNAGVSLTSEVKRSKKWHVAKLEAGRLLDESSFR